MIENNPKVLYGKKFAQPILDQIHQECNALKINGLRQPCLAVILVGDDSASEIYVRNKKNACAKTGIKSLEFKLASDLSQNDLLKLIKQLNADDQVDGILVQLPLPKHLDAKLVINTISPNKDVDGFHCYNMGSLAINDPNICPCTPHGIMYILDNLSLNYHGLHAVILGTSNIVGRPMALELINRGTTVTICNSKTINLPAIIGQADILISAIGNAGFVDGKWLKINSIVIDVGINRMSDGSLCGDVNFHSAIAKVRYITPVPGGIGPMTIAMLLKNLLHCYQLNSSKEML